MSPVYSESSYLCKLVSSRWRTQWPPQVPLFPCSSIDKVIAKVHRREGGAILTTFDLQWHVSWVVHGYKWQCLFALLHYRPDDDSWNVSKLLSELKLVTDNLLFIYHQSNQANGSLTSTSVMDSTTKEKPLEEMAGEKQAIILQPIAHANTSRYNLYHVTETNTRHHANHTYTCRECGTKRDTPLLLSNTSESLCP